MNVDNQTILHIKSGHLPPDELMQMLLAKKPTAFGFGVQEADGAPMQVMREDGEALDMETLKSFLKERKERPTTMAFQMLKKGYNVEDIMPYIVTDPTDGTFMTLWCEGDIVGHTEEGHIEQANFITSIVIPKVLDLCETFEGDIAKIMAKIDGPVFRKDITTHFGHRGILHVLPFEGEPVVVQKDNKLFKEFDWGWMSQNHGFGEKAAEEPKAEVAPKKSWGYGNRTVKAETPAPAPEQKPADKPAEKANPPGVHNVPEQKKADDKPVAVFVRPPSWLLKNEDKKEFYVIVNGKQHPGWKKSLPVEVTQNHGILQCKNLDDYNKWKLANLKGQLETSAPMASNVEKPKTKQERLAEQAIQGPVDSTPLPTLEPKTLEKVLDFVAQHLDGNSKEIMDPKKMQEIEATLPKFSDAVGVTLEEMLNWPVSGLFGMAAVDAKAAVLWGLQWRNYARPFLIAEMKAKKNNEVVTTQTTDLGNGSKKVESVVTPAPAAATKKSWGYGKKAA